MTTRTILLSAAMALTLLRSTSPRELLETTARLTNDAVELLHLQMPDDPA